MAVAFWTLDSCRLPRRPALPLAAAFLGLTLAPKVKLVSNLLLAMFSLLRGRSAALHSSCAQPPVANRPLQLGRAVLLTQHDAPQHLGTVGPRSVVAAPGSPYLDLNLDRDGGDQGRHAVEHGLFQPGGHGVGLPLVALDN